MLSKIEKNAEKWALIYFYCLLVSVMALEVVRREVFSYSSIWGEEIVKMSLVYLTWIGAAVAIRDRAHIRIDVIFNYLSNRKKILLYILGDIVTLAVAIMGLILTFEVVLVALHNHSETDGLRISRAWFLMAVPIGCALMIFRLIQAILRDLRDYRENNPAYTGEKMFD